MQMFLDDYYTSAFPTSLLADSAEPPSQPGFVVMLAAFVLPTFRRFLRRPLHRLRVRPIVIFIIVGIFICLPLFTLYLGHFTNFCQFLKGASRTTHTMCPMAGAGARREESWRWRNCIAMFQTHLFLSFCGAFYCSFCCSSAASTAPQRRQHM